MHGNALKLALPGLVLMLACSKDTTAEMAPTLTSSFTLCNGSDEVRLGIISSGGMLEPTSEFTNPYGHAFLFVNGRCQLLAGGPEGADRVEGDLTESLAKRLQEVARASEQTAWREHQDEACPDSGATFVRTASDGFGGCACGCDDDAPQELKSFMDELSTLRAQAYAAGSAFAGDLQAMPLRGEEGLGTDYVSSRFDATFAEEDFATLEELSRRDGHPLVFYTLRDADAAEARKLRRKAFAENKSTTLHILDAESGPVDLYLVDPTPKAWDLPLMDFDYTSF